MNGVLDKTKYTIKTYFITTGRTSVRPFFFFMDGKDYSLSAVPSKDLISSEINF